MSRRTSTSLQARSQVRAVPKSSVAVPGIFGCAVLLAATLMSCAEDSCTAPVVEAPERCVVVRDFDEPPMLLRLQAPVYPEQARREEVEGTVHVLVVVGTDSLPCGVRITSSDSSLLDLASLEAALHSTWIPARRRGRVVAAEVDVPFRFSLNKDGPICEGGGVGGHGPAR